MEQRVISENSKRFFEFIEQLKKAARLDSPTAEISRMYEEVADILSEAFDEYNPEDLPKYQRRLDNIIRLQQTEEALSDPLFKEDLQKAEQLLDSHVKQRFGAFQKVSRLAGSIVRGVGGSSVFINDFLSIGEQAGEAGRRAGEAFSSFKQSFKFGRRQKLTAEEERQTYDILKGNNQTTTQTSSPSAQATTLPSAPNKEIISVKDDKLIGTNTQQNKLLLDLYKVSKDSSVDIKKIRGLLDAQLKILDDTQDKEALNKQEAMQEGKASVRSAQPGILQTFLGGRQQSSPEQNNNKPENNVSAGDAVVAGGAGAALLAATKKVGGLALKYGKKILPMARKVAPWLAKRAGTFATGPVGSAIGTALTAYEVGGLINDYAVDPAKEAITSKMTDVGRSITQTIGEKTKGIDYYKDLFKQNNLDEEGTEKAEQGALQFLKKAASDKQELFNKSYANGETYGNRKYLINDEPARIEQAKEDVKAAQQQAKDYEEYLKAKNKYNKGGKATGIFKREGKIWSNPLYTKEEMKQIWKENEGVAPKALDELEIVTIPEKNLKILKSETFESQLHTPSQAPTPTAQKVKSPTPTPQIYSRNIIDHNPVLPSPSVPPTIGEKLAPMLGDDAKSKLSTTPKPQPAPMPTPADEKAVAVTNRLMKDMNISQEDAAAIVGNLIHESAGLKPDINEKNPVVPGSRGGYGWAQWTGSRRREFESFAKENNLDIKSDEANYQFLVHELRSSESKSIDAIKNAQGVEAKTVAFEKAYERAGIKHHASRIKHANRVLSNLQANKNAMENVDVKQSKSQMAFDVTRPEIKLTSAENNSQLALNQLSKDYEKSKMQPVIIPMPTPNPASQGQAAVQGPTSRTVGASPNGASESSLMVALRQSISPLN